MSSAESLKMYSMGILPLHGQYYSSNLIYDSRHNMAVSVPSFIGVQVTAPDAEMTFIPERKQMNTVGFQVIPQLYEPKNVSLVI